MKIKSILIVFLIVITIFTSNISLARIGTTGVILYTKNDYTGLIKYNGENIELQYTVHKYNGKEYPAYSQDYKVYGGAITYTVDIIDEIIDLNLWRIVINGYPYKSYTELGCSSSEEAYLATKLAIYNYLYNCKIEEFEVSNDMGQKVIDTMQYIMNLAQNSTAKKILPRIEVLSGTNDEWKLDIETDCLYKVYKVQLEYPRDIKTKIVLEGDIPEGVVITNIDNEVKEEFEYGEDIKLSIPRINLIKNGSFNIQFMFEIDALPAYYATTNTSGYRPYILTDEGIKKMSITKKEEYDKHSEKVEIDVKDATTEKPLTNVEFELLDQEKKYINTYKTDENGEIVINALPGNYYLKQTKVDEQYSMLDRFVPIEIKLDKQIKIHFMLNKKEEIVIETEDKNITVSETNKIFDLNTESIYINIKDLLGCPLNTETDKSEDNVNTSIQESEQHQDKAEQISDVIKENNNIKKLPRTGM